MNKVSRREYKYLMTVNEFEKYKYQFANILKEDKNNGSTGYMVRSLYFDTLNNKDFTDKTDGLEVRKKIRLRIYDLKSEWAILEMKQKQGIHQLKRSLNIKKEDAILLSQGIYTPLLTYEESFAVECFAIMNRECYRPKAIVQYKRNAFIAKENNIRITFDSDIVATESCFELFSHTLNLYPVFNPFYCVLEVKYNGFLLSYIKDMVDQMNRSQLSVSKYCLGRNVSLKYVF